jgi:hypothetical protein
VSRAELCAAIARFVRPSDVICAWGHFGVELIRAAGAELPAAGVDLRAAAQRLLHRKVGTLEQFAATFGALPPALAAGRAGARVAMLVRIVETWRAAHA